MEILWLQQTDRNNHHLRLHFKTSIERKAAENTFQQSSVSVKMKENLILPTLRELKVRVCFSFQCGALRNSKLSVFRAAVKEAQVPKQTVTERDRELNISSSVRSVDGICACQARAIGLFFFF